MKHMINIGNENRFDETSYLGLVKGITQIFESSEEYHVDEVTTRKALEILIELSSVKGITVEGSSFINNPDWNKPVEKKEDEDEDED